MANHSARKALVKKKNSSEPKIGITGHNHKAGFYMQMIMVIRYRSLFLFPNDDRYYQSISTSNPFSYNNCTDHFCMNNQVLNAESFCFLLNTDPCY